MWLFLRLLGGIYAIAFLSLWVQVEGLIGERGILPAGELLARATEVLGPGVERFWRLPTLLWLGSGDAALHALCALGVAGGILLALGLAPRPVLLSLWALYLTLVTAGRDFLAFQWDNLLLESGFLAILMAPLGRARLATMASPARLPVFLLHWLLFRLNFSSGFVKLASGDPTWRNLTALTYHYETQPLPTWIGWFVHQLPASFHLASALVMFAVELLVPLLIFAPRRLRLGAAAALAALQVAIGLTGNYTFFNLLTIALCLTLVDDDCWPWTRLARGRGEGAWPGEAEGTPGQPSRQRSRWQRFVVAPLAVLLLVLSGLEMTATLGFVRALPAPLVQRLRWVAPLRSVNGYGLFAVMTTARPEIVVEGSVDGVTWHPYEFRWKPGPLDRRPGFVEPHQPRLDWQMWFAALGGQARTPWFDRFLARLLEGSPEVHGLLAENPFPHGPPRYVRAELYGYRFTGWGTLRETGRWWERRYLGPYAPAMERSPASSGSSREPGRSSTGSRSLRNSLPPGAPSSSIASPRTRSIAPSRRATTGVAFSSRNSASRWSRVSPMWVEEESASM